MIFLMKMINFIKIKKKKTDSTVTSTGINFNELSIRVVGVLFRRRILRHFSSFHTRRTPKKKKKTKTFLYDYERPK